MPVVLADHRPRRCRAQSRLFGALVDARMALADSAFKAHGRVLEHARVVGLECRGDTDCEGRIRARQSTREVVRWQLCVGASECHPFSPAPHVRCVQRGSCPGRPWRAGTSERWARNNAASAVALDEYWRTSGRTYSSMKRMLTNDRWLRRMA